MSVVSFGDLPLGDRNRRWDGTAAEKRVRKWAGAQDAPNQKYRRAHVWYDRDAKDNFTAHKLLIADVVDGELTVMPRAVMAAGAIMQGSRGGVDLDRVSEHFAARCRAVVRIPFDAHLEEGAEIDLDRLEPGTRLALLDLAAHVADAFERVHAL